MWPGLGLRGERKWWKGGREAQLLRPREQMARKGHPVSLRQGQQRGLLGNFERVPVPWPLHSSAVPTPPGRNVWGHGEPSDGPRARGAEGG